MAPRHVSPASWCIPPTFHSVTVTHSRGVRPPISRALIQMALLANPRAFAGNQLYRAFEMFGNAPASPTPNRNWMRTSPPNPTYNPPTTASGSTAIPTNPVRNTNALHQSTTRRSTARGPCVSPSQPLGTSNRA